MQYNLEQETLQHCDNLRRQLLKALKSWKNLRQFSEKTNIFFQKVREHKNIANSRGLDMAKSYCFFSEDTKIFVIPPISNLIIRHPIYPLINRHHIIRRFCHFTKHAFWLPCTYSNPFFWRKKTFGISFFLQSSTCLFILRLPATFSNIGRKIE